MAGDRADTQGMSAQMAIAREGVEFLRDMKREIPLKLRARLMWAVRRANRRCGAKPSL